MASLEKRSLNCFLINLIPELVAPAGPLHCLICCCSLIIDVSTTTIYHQASTAKAFLMNFLQRNLLGGNEFNRTYLLSCVTGRKFYQCSKYLRRYFDSSTSLFCFLLHFERREKCQLRHSPPYSANILVLNNMRQERMHLPGNHPLD
jgi:hypothetical protein